MLQRQQYRNLQPTSTDYNRQQNHHVNYEYEEKLNSQINKYFSPPSPTGSTTQYNFDRVPAQPMTSLYQRDSEDENIPTNYTSHKKRQVFTGPTSPTIIRKIKPVPSVIQSAVYPLKQVLPDISGGRFRG